ncbi:MAG: hypothetical protein H3Z50_06240 [archaeon]|nr:hypothetical protein [archaeon]MCP8305500.1 hypothetical protein [archaeon]
MEGRPKVYYSEKFERCRNMGDIFELVKETTERSIGRRRAGLTLYLANLPLYIGALYKRGSNTIVMNRLVLEAMKKITELKDDADVFTYVILLHEYLHTLGYSGERQVRTLAYKISIDSFGPNHKITEFSRKGLSSILPQIIRVTPKRRGMDLNLEIVKDFDRSSITYIS